MSMRLQYPNYEKVLVNFTNFKKEAQKRLQIVKHQSDKNKDMEVKIERNELLKVEKEVLDLNIKQLELTVDVNLAQDIDELDNYISKMETFPENL